MAAKYYEQAKKEMEEKKHNVTYAYRYGTTLKEYAVILKKIGNNEESIKYSSKSQQITNSVEVNEVYTTPFGANCKAP